MADRRWKLLTEAEPRLLGALTELGVSRVRLSAGFPLDHFTVWLATQSDAQALALRRVDDLFARVATVLRGSGFSDSDLRSLGVVVQSQETVDRDYEGSWFYAMR